MEKRVALLLLVILFPLLSIAGNNDDGCSENTGAFKAGEKVTYNVYYNLRSMWVGAGKVVFSVEDTEWKGRSFYNLKGEGSTFKRYDWFFKVRDVYQSYIDKSTIEPSRFLRDVNEGGFTIFQDYHFNRSANSVTAHREDSKSNMRVDTFPVNNCVHDILSAVYHVRSLDFNSYAEGDSIFFRVFLDDVEYDMYVRYLGKDRLTLDGDTYNCIKFSPLLLQGTIFNEGEGMTVWVTDDKNKMPLMVEAPILVGSVKATLKSYEGLAHPVDALVAD